MSNDRKFDADSAQLKEIFFTEDSRLHVPDYQREFSWGVDQVSAFWEELVGPDAEKGKFAGTVLLLDLGVNGSVEIVDGQQRASIATIVLAAIRDIANSKGHKAFAENMQKRDIQIEDPETFELGHYRLAPSLTCRDFFIDTIQSFPTKNTQPDTKEHLRVKQAYDYFAAQINELICKEGVDEKVSLAAIRSKVRELRVVRIDVYDESVKFEIFESVNARGLSLSPADLIKNYVISKISETKRAAVNEKWIEMVQRSEGINIAFTDVIRYVWNGNYRFVTKANLFNEIKKFKKTQAQIETFVVELDEAVNAIETLKNGTRDDVKEGFSGNKAHAASFERSNALMNLLDVRLHLVMFSTLFQQRKVLPPAHVDKFSRLLAQFCLAHVGLCQNPISRIERYLASTSQKIVEAAKLTNEKKRKQKLDSIFTIASKDVCQKYWPSNELIDERLCDVRYENSAQSKRLIRSLMSSIEMLQVESGELVIDWPAVNIEHIQPQNPDDPKESKKYVDCIHDLGNLTLITEKLNKKLGNKPPIEKSELMSGSALRITRQLAEQIDKEGWSPKIIDTRTKELRKNLSGVLHRPIS